MWSLAAAGHVRDQAAADDLQTRLTAILADPRFGTGLSTFHADTTPPVRIALHLPAGDPLARACA